jgi:benzoyl-CoA reductase/2-hydroxyglutaryl-CoA dehydratase subunit BcrC/BadD/HgdB
MLEGITELIGVHEGDCSNTKVLIDILKSEGITIHPFSYPQSHSLEHLTTELQKFMNHFRVTLEEVEKVRLRLNSIRQYGLEVDHLTYLDEKATGFENHLYQLCLSDFNGDIVAYEASLKGIVTIISSRPTNPKTIRLGYIGVPPMTGDLFDFVEDYDARIIYNEVQREFAFPRGLTANSIFEQYHDYTYPYDFDFRLAEIKQQIRERKLHAVIHYSQAFCHKSAETILLKKALDIPILVIEGDQETQLDARTKLRIEAFLDMLKDRVESKV